MVGEREIKRGNSFSKRMFNQKFDLPEGIDIDGICSEMTRGGKLVISAPQLKTQVAAAGAGADEGTKEVTKTGEEVVSTSEGEIQLEGGGTAKTSGSSTSKKSKEVREDTKIPKLQTSGKSLER